MLIEIDFKSGLPVYLQVVDQIKAAPEYKSASKPVSVVEPPDPDPASAPITPAISDPMSPAATVPTIRQ